jgi:hypothetical protein
VRKGVFCITTKNNIAEKSTERKKKTLNRLFDAGGVSLDKAVKGGSSTRRAVATIPSTTSAITFDVVLPVGAKDNGTTRARDRRTEHAKGVELVKLFEFAGVPKRPCVELFELAAGKVTKGLFSSGGGLRTNRAKGNAKSRNGNRGRRKVVVLEAYRGYGTNIGNGKSVDSGVGRSGRSVEVELLGSLRTCTRGRKLFWGKNKVKRRGAAILKFAKTSNDVCSGEDRAIIDLDDISTAERIIGSLERGEEGGSTTVGGDLSAFYQERLQGPQSTLVIAVNKTYQVGSVS